MIDALPLPDVMPPAQVAAACRLDSPAEIRSLARKWRNCLEGFVLTSIRVTARSISGMMAPLGSLSCVAARPTRLVL